MKPMILMLGSADVQVVLNALVRHADLCEQEGDPLHEAPVADRVADQVRALEDLDSEQARQLLLSVGLGTARGRPQG